jgi:hypothetical protein
MTMTGSQPNPTKADFSPEGALPHESAMHPRARTRGGAAASPTRLKRMIHRWMAAANAYRERQAALLASHRASGAKLNNMRIYRGPIDDALERAARLRQRRRRKQSLN